MGKTPRKKRIRKRPPKSVPPQPKGPIPAVWSGASKGRSNGSDQAHGGGSSSVARPKILQRLYQNDGEALFQMLSLFPLLLGVWASGGLYLQEFNSFSIVLATLMIAQYLEMLSSRRSQIAFFEQIYIFAYAGIAALVVLFYYINESLESLLVFVCLAGLFLVTPKLDRRSIRVIVLYAFARIAQMGLLAVMGAFCQTREIYWPVSILGLLPGSLLAAVLVAKNARFLEGFGWSRSFTTNDIKTGQNLTRPGAVTRLYSLFLILGPSLPAMLLPFQLVPDVMLLGLIPLYFMPTLATDFLQRTRSDEVIALDTLKLATLASICMLLGVLFASLL